MWNEKNVKWKAHIDWVIKIYITKIKWIFNGKIKFDLKFEKIKQPTEQTREIKSMGWKVWFTRRCVRSFCELLWRENVYFTMVRNSDESGVYLHQRPAYKNQQTRFSYHKFATKSQWCPFQPRALRLGSHRWLRLPKGVSRVFHITWEFATSHSSNPIDGKNFNILQCNRY